MTTNWFHTGAERRSPQNKANPLPDYLKSLWTEAPAKGRSQMSHAPHQFLQDVTGFNPDELQEKDGILEEAAKDKEKLAAEIKEQ